MRRTPAKIGLALGLGALTAGGLGGCLAAGGTDIDIEGQKISGRTFGLLTPGSTEDDVVELLGPPTRVAERANGNRLLVYEYRREVDSGGHFLLLFAGGSEKVEQQRAFVRVRNGLVTEYWADGDFEIEPVRLGAG